LLEKTAAACESTPRYDKCENSMNFRVLLWLVLGAIPLFIYPFLLIANVMSLAGEPSHNPVSLALRLSSQGFLWSSTLYPVVYVGCAIMSVIQSQWGDGRTAERCALLPLLYLVGVAALFLLWLATSE
jgi:hypothetical protein